MRVTPFLAVAFLTGGCQLFGAHPDNPDESNVPQQAVTMQDGVTYLPGWMVELHTAHFPNGLYQMNPGYIAAYRGRGPQFDEATIVKRSRLGGSSQVVVGNAVAKFVARAAGQYQFGLRLEPDDAWCVGNLWLNGSSLIERIGITESQIVVVPVNLSPGLYDARLEFGCTDESSGPTDRGKVTVVVEHPGDLAPKAALPSDFISAAPGEAMPAQRPAQGVPVIRPSGPLPPDASPAH